MHMHKEGKLIL